MTARSFVYFLSLLLLWFALLVLFYHQGQLDIDISNSFFTRTACASTLTDAVCGVFPYRGDELLRLLRQFLFHVPTIAALLLVWLLVRALLPRGGGRDLAKARQYSLSLLALVIGPYILVNLLLKSFSGRPRPDDTALFGGPHTFMPAGSFAGQCDNNCSFVSGEAAGAGWVACLVPLLPARLRPVLAPPILVVCAVTPALRIAFGGHYFSDVVLGWLSSVVVYAGVFGVAEFLRQWKTFREEGENQRKAVAKPEPASYIGP